MINHRFNSYSSRGISPLAAKQRALYPEAFPILQTAVPRRGINGFGAQSTAKGSVGGAAAGASMGASIGSVVPGIGTAIGAIGGAIGGAIAGALGGTQHQEAANFAQAVNAWQQNRLSVLNIANKYLPLAGLFGLDIRTNIPIFKKYGRNGEERFTVDLANTIYAAAQAGKIQPSDSVQDVMVKVVQPWIDTWGFGPMADPHADMINLLIMGMIGDYVSGAAPQIWRARGGDLPASFSRIPAFSMPTPQGQAAPSPVAQYAPGTAVATAPVQAVVPIAPPQKAAAAQPQTVLSSDGASVQPGSGSALRNAQGVLFWFGDPLNQGGNAIWASDSSRQPFITNAGNGAAVAMGLLNGGTVYARNALGTWYQWNGASDFIAIPGPPQQTQVTSAPTPSSTTVAIPAGFTQVGTDAASGIPVYQGADGRLYEWTGTTMQPMNGSVVIGGQLLNVSGGTVQPAAPAGGTPAGGNYIPPGYGAAPPTYAPSPTPAPATPAVAAAGIGAGAPTWLPWVALGGLGLFFVFGKSKGGKGFLPHGH